MNPIYMQLFLLLNVFLIGALTVIAIQHAYAHFKPDHSHDNDKRRAHPPTTPLPAATRQKLLQASEANFQSVLDKAARELQHDLQTTTNQLNKQLSSLGTAIASEEMKRYRASLDHLREQTETAIGGAQTEIEKHQADLKARLAEKQAQLEAEIAQRRTELEAQLTEEMAVEKQRLVSQIDTKLADAVASFLTETLQHNVDLGAQSVYLTSMLNEHKDELAKGIKE